MKIFCISGCRIIAEDLGTVPDYVRQSLARLGVPGFKVLRWERDWDAPGQPFRDPASYPAVSVALTGTHDTEPMRVWWEHAPAEERAAALQVPGLDVSGASPESPFSPALRDGFLRVLFHAGSDLLMLPIQDVFAWSDRINVPATVGADNWTYRLPWPVDRLSDIREAREAAARLRRWAEESGRTMGARPTRASRETAGWCRAAAELGVRADDHRATRRQADPSDVGRRRRRHLAALGRGPRADSRERARGDRHCHARRGVVQTGARETRTRGQVSTHSRMPANQAALLRI
jgi:hypothetical protein